MKNSRLRFSDILVASQTYRATVPEESVILGNDVVIKCNIPSFVADFVSVVGWVDSEGSTFLVSQSDGNFISMKSLIVLVLKNVKSESQIT